MIIDLKSVGYLITQIIPTDQLRISIPN